MKFTAVQQLLRNKQSEMVALESLDEIGTVNIDGVSLRIGLCTAVSYTHLRAHET